ncbi:MAG: hypothetical protein R3E96_05620 [Planctomycetota bacterium]
MILPAANLRNLVLRREVVEACRQGRFHVYAVDHISEALELFTGVPAGTADDEGQYPDGTLFAKAMDMLHEYWYRSRGLRRENGGDTPPEA